MDRHKLSLYCLFVCLFCLFFLWSKVHEMLIKHKEKNCNCQSRSRAGPVRFNAKVLIFFLLGIKASIS